VPRSIAIADLNHDGIADVVLANSGAGTLTVFVGEGNGLFGSGQRFNAAGAWAMTVTDLDRDGRLDVAVADIVSSRVGVFLNTSP
jgi:hypothetical protein